MALPQWATPERLEYLVRLFAKCGGFCVHGHKPCPHPDHHYELYINGFDIEMEVTEEAFSVELESESTDLETGKPVKEWAYVKKPVPVVKTFHMNGLIDDWKQDDREARTEQRRLENRVLHDMPDKHGWGRRFDPVTREQFFDRQPLYYIEGLGVSGLTFRPIAKVRVPSTLQHLFVDVPRRKMSKNQRRKAKRYHHQSVHTNCEAAVKDFLNNR